MLFSLLSVDKALMCDFQLISYSSVLLHDPGYSSVIFSKFLKKKIITQYSYLHMLNALLNAVSVFLNILLNEVI